MKIRACKKCGELPEIKYNVQNEVPYFHLKCSSPHAWARCLGESDFNKAIKVWNEHGYNINPTQEEAKELGE